MECAIPTSVPMDQLLALSPPEKIAVIGALWDSMEDAAAAGPLPSWQLDELARRLDADLAAPEPTFSWEEAQQLVKSRHGQTRSP